MPRAGPEPVKEEKQVRRGRRNLPPPPPVSRSSFRCSPQFEIKTELNTTYVPVEIASEGLRAETLVLWFYGGAQVRMWSPLVHFSSLWVPLQALNSQKLPDCHDGGTRWGPRECTMRDDPEPI